MFKRFGKVWRSLRASAPGCRFQDRYHRLRGKRKNRILHSTAGVIMIFIGALLVFLPGPGLAFLLLGAGLLAPESLTIARALDRAELRARGAACKIGKWWRKS